jgi:DNA-binding MarR family transcriptional regulator
LIIGQVTSSPYQSHDKPQADVLHNMQIPAHGISRILEVLEDQGFLERSLNPDDARKRKLTMTKKGIQILEHVVSSDFTNKLISL